MKLMKAVGNGKRVWSLVTLGAVAAMLLLPLALVFAPESSFAEEAAVEGCEAGKGKDVYFKTEGCISGPPAPQTTAKDYPAYDLAYPLSESRVIVWTIAQQHLYFGSFVLAVPIFCIALGMYGATCAAPWASNELMPMRCSAMSAARSKLLSPSAAWISPMATR